MKAKKRRVSRAMEAEQALLEKEATENAQRHAELARLRQARNRKSGKALPDELVKFKNMGDYTLSRFEDGSVEIREKKGQWKLEIGYPEDVLSLIEALAWIAKR